jgi:hypothetical protein
MWCVVKKVCGKGKGKGKVCGMWGKRYVVTFETVYRLIFLVEDA